MEQLITTDHAGSAAAGTQKDTPMSNMPAAVPYEMRRKSIWSCLYSLQEVLPGLLAMFFIAIFSNNLAGVPNPFTLENLFAYLDNVIGPVNGQGFFQIMNANFVWNALLAGLIIGNVFGVPESWKRGLSYIHKLMPLGIIMLGPHFVLSHGLKAGFGPMLIAVVMLLVTAGLALKGAKLFKVDDRQASIVAGGLATGDPHVCAILMPMIKAKGGQVVNATACVILFGLLASFLLPLLGKLTGLSEQAFGLASALSIGNGAQAASSGFAYGYEAGRYARYYDAVRHAIMPAGFLYVFLVMFWRKLKYKNDPTVMATRGVDTIPPYVIVFVLGWGLACLHLFKEPAHHAIFDMVKWDFSLAAAALGLSLPLKEILSWGWRGFALTSAVGLVRIALVLGTLFACVKFGWLGL
jgi:uncharacterized membrane protein YadS